MVEIGDMVIRVPSMSEEEAGQLGDDVAKCIAADLSQINDTRNKHVGELTIRLSWQEGMNNTEMADTIAKQLLLQLNSI